MQLVHATLGQIAQHGLQIHFALRVGQIDHCGTPRLQCGFFFIILACSVYVASATSYK